MSATQVPLQPLKKGSMLKLWLGLLLVAAVAIALAWVGTGRFRPEITQSGIEFRTLKSGEGPLVQKEDALLIDYVGTLDDGTVFNDTQGQAVPITPLAVVPGFAEALMKMQSGGTYKFRLPPELGYGASPPAGLPANAALNFEVQVHQVAPGAGMMVIQQQQQQQMGGGR